MNLLRPALMMAAAVPATFWLGFGIAGRSCGWDVMRNVPYRRLLQIYVRKRYRTTPALLTVGVELMTFLWALSPIRD